MIVLGIDPGFRNVGISLISAESGRIMKELAHRHFGARPGTSEATAMKHIHDVVMSDLETHRPDAVAVEQYIMGEKEVLVVDDDGKPVVHVLRARQVLMAYGVILGAVAEYGLEPFFYTPSQVKAVATLHGGSGKDAVGFWASQILGVAPVNEHVDDARAVAISHAVRRPGVASERVAVMELAQ